jgi:hypothetical protein
MVILSKSFSWLAIFTALFLIIALVRFVFRAKYAENLSKLPRASQDRIIRADKDLLKIFRSNVWVIPFCLIVFPIVVFAFLREIFVSSTICMILFVIAMLQEYYFRRWIINYLEDHRLSQSGL